MNKLLDWIDEQLSRITMYNLVFLGLVLMIMVSFMLMFTGYLSYKPINFAIGIALLVGVSYGSNRLFGWLFGVRPHSQSAVITGLILALLFSPPTSLFIGIKFVLIAVIAMASKYVITYRNKHIFNPVAFAVVTASVTKIAFASWWIATPALLPVALLVSGAILLKTRKIQMAGVYLTVSILTILVLTAFGGGLTVDSTFIAITSWPLVFFAGVMLTEPLTLPPRHTQQLYIAALVGFLGVSSLHYGPITITPALALIIGNAVAWRWGTRGSIKLRLVHKRQLSKRAYEFTFDTNMFRYNPGQYIEMTVPHSKADSRGVRRIFSIIGHPGDNQISVAMRIPEKPSTFKRKMLSLKTPQIIYGARIAGDFLLPKDESIPIVMIAGGIGITPFLSHIMSAGKRKVTLIYVVSSADELLYADELKRYNINVVVVAPSSVHETHGHWIYIKSKQLNEQILEKCIRIYDQPHVYISGAPHMVNETKHTVRRLGVKHIKTDHFAGY